MNNEFNIPKERTMNNRYINQKEEERKKIRTEKMTMVCPFLSSNIIEISIFHR
jgi:hypothetical protein